MTNQKKTYEQIKRKKHITRNHCVKMSNQKIKIAHIPTDRQNFPNTHKGYRLSILYAKKKQESHSQANDAFVRFTFGSSISLSTNVSFSII